MDLEYLKDHAVKAHGSTSCPNCGAAIESDKCSYCGAVFVDFAAMDTEKPFFLKIKHNGEVHILRVAMQTCNIEVSRNDISVYGSDRGPLLMTFPSYDRTLEIIFNVLD